MGAGQVLPPNWYNFSTESAMKLKLLTLVLLATFVFVAPARSEGFVFTAIPDEDESQLRTRFDKVANYLSKSLGVNVTFVPVKSYAAAVTAFRNSQVQLAWFGGLSGVRARALVKNSVAIAQGAEDKGFQTYFIAHASTNLTKSAAFPKAMAGKTFTFGSKGSTSGRLMPEYFIRKNLQKAPNRVFRRVGYSGDHSRTIALVQSGAFQVGAVNFQVWKKQMAAGKIDTAKVSVIWETPEYPDYNWTIRGDVEKKFGPDFVAKVKSTLLNMRDPDLLKSFPRKSFISASNSDYQPIVDVGREIGLIE
jgi:phosphonate transport system substrate-binding protein